MGINIGDKFNRLTVVGIGKKDNVGRRFYICQCDCGSPVKEVQEWNLKTGAVKSCGCLAKENGKKVIKKAHKTLAEKRWYKNFGCTVCGSDKHYAKGLCKNCYNRNRRGTLWSGLKEK